MSQRALKEVPTAAETCLKCNCTVKETMLLVPYQNDMQERIERMIKKRENEPKKRKSNKKEANAKKPKLKKQLPKKQEEQVAGADSAVYKSLFGSSKKNPDGQTDPTLYMSGALGYGL